MDRYVDELHNHEDASSLTDSILFFVGVVILLFSLGAIFWSAF